MSRSTTNTVLLHYQHPETQQNVFIQGMIHVAPSSFFQTVNEHIKQFLQNYPEQSLVLLEFVKPASTNPEEIAALKAKMSDLMSRLTRIEGFSLERLYALIAKVMNCETQYLESYLRDIPTEKTAIADMSSEEFLAFLLSKPAIQAVMQAEEKYQYRLATWEKLAKFAPIRWVAAWILKRSMKTLLRQSDPDYVPESKPKKQDNIHAQMEDSDDEPHLKEFMDITQHERNRLLIDKLSQHLQSQQHLFITYGAAHFSPKQRAEFDVLKFLESKGFQRVSRQEVAVF